MTVNTPGLQVHVCAEHASHRAMPQLVRAAQVGSSEERTVDLNGGGQLVLQLKSRRNTEPPSADGSSNMTNGDTGRTTVAVRRLRLETYPQCVQLYLDLDDAVALHRLSKGGGPQAGLKAPIELVSVPKHLAAEVRPRARRLLGGALRLCLGACRAARCQQERLPLMQLAVSPLRAAGKDGGKDKAAFAADGGYAAQRRPGPGTRAQSIVAAPRREHCLDRQGCLESRKLGVGLG